MKLPKLPKISAIISKDHQIDILTGKERVNATQKENYRLTHSPSVIVDGAPERAAYTKYHTEYPTKKLSCYPESVDEHITTIEDWKKFNAQPKNDANHKTIVRYRGTEFKNIHDAEVISEVDTTSKKLAFPTIWQLREQSLIKNDKTATNKHTRSIFSPKKDV